MKLVVDEHLTGDTSQRVDFTVTGKTIEEIHEKAYSALQRLVPDRPFGIRHLLIAPLLTTDGARVEVWEAAVEAVIPPCGPTRDV